MISWIWLIPAVVISFIIGAKLMAKLLIKQLMETTKEWEET